MNLRLVLHRTNPAWILEKFAHRLAEQLGAYGVDATISDAPSAAADVHHYMMYLHGPPKRSRPSSAFITHVQRPKSVIALHTLLDRVDVGICLSRMTVEQLVD